MDKKTKKQKSKKNSYYWKKTKEELRKKKAEEGKGKTPIRTIREKRDMYLSIYSSSFFFLLFFSAPRLRFPSFSSLSSSFRLSLFRSLSFFLLLFPFHNYVAKYKWSQILNVCKKMKKAKRKEKKRRRGCGLILAGVLVLGPVLELVE